MLYLVSVGIFSVYFMVDPLKTSHGREFDIGSAYFIVWCTLLLVNAALLLIILITREPDLKAKYLGYIEAVCCLHESPSTSAKKTGIYRDERFWG